MVGPPRGFAPSERLDAQRTGRSTTRLPFPPIEVWKRNVAGGFDLPPVVDAQGNLVAAETISEVIKISPEGKELWRARVGTNSAVMPPAITSDGTVVVITGAGLAWGITPSGSIRYATALGIKAGSRFSVAPLALEDGGILVGAGRVLVELDSDGAVRARATLDEPAIGALLMGPDGALITTDSGDVYTFRAPFAPRKVGSFGSAPRRGGVLADRRTLLGVVDGRRIVALDLPTGTTHVRAGAPAAGGLYDAPVAVTAAGLAVTTTYGGLLVGVDAAGTEKISIPVDKVVAPAADAGAAAPSSFLGTGELRASPPVVVDDEGRVAFARAGGRVGVVGPDGTVAIASSELCTQPSAVVPAGDRRLVVTCVDGQVWMFGE